MMNINYQLHRYYQEQRIKKLKIAISDLGQAAEKVATAFDEFSGCYKVASHEIKKGSSNANT
jgi:hypothetical protein